MIKVLFLAFAFLLSLHSFSQQKTITKYYDSAWSPTTKQSAFYSAEFVREGDFYKCTAYWVASKKMNGKGFFADTSFTKPRQLLINYYENGHMQDSSWYDETGQATFNYHYHKNGKLMARRLYDPRSKKETVEGYDQEGNIKKDFVYAKEAEYPDGHNAWIRFLSKNLNTKVPVTNGAPTGTYQVMILFVIGKNGEVIDIKPETKHGYGMEEEAMRVIRNSPRWNPLISVGEPQNAYRRQPVTFAVTAK